MVAVTVTLPCVIALLTERAGAWSRFLSSLLGRLSSLPSAGPFFLAMQVPAIKKRREDVVIDPCADGVWQRTGHQAGKPAHAGQFLPYRDEGGQAGKLIRALPDVQALEGSLRGQGPIGEAVAADRGKAERRTCLSGAVLVMGDLHPADGAVGVIKHFDVVFAVHDGGDSAGAGGTSPCDWTARGGRDRPEPMRILDNIISDRGSKYAVSGGPVASAEEAKAFIRELCRKKKFAKATHNTWAVLLPEGPLKNDDGEAGAGMVIVRMLEREGVEGHLVCVTRWFGGKHLGGDRFRHVQEAVRIYLEAEAGRR